MTQHELERRAQELKIQLLERRLQEHHRPTDQALLTEYADNSAFIRHQDTRFWVLMAAVIVLVGGLLQLDVEAAQRRIMCVFGASALLAVLLVAEQYAYWGRIRGKRARRIEQILALRAFSNIRSLNKDAKSPYYWFVRFESASIWVVRLWFLLILILLVLWTSCSPASTGSWFMTTLPSFDSASADMPRESLLSAICDVRQTLQARSPMVVVVGRHDEQPLGAMARDRFRSNEALAQERAAWVVRRLAETSPSWCEAAPLKQALPIAVGPRGDGPLSDDRRVEVWAYGSFKATPAQ